MSLSAAKSSEGKSSDAKAEKRKKTPGETTTAPGETNVLWRARAVGAVQAKPAAAAAGGNMTRWGAGPLVQRLCTECREEDLPTPETASVQASLTIGAPDDPYEKEADAVAAQVMRKASVPLQVQRKVGSASPMLQLACGQLVPDQSILQCKEAGESTSRGLTRVHKAISSPGPGSTLHPQVRAQVEPVLGVDLSGVRVHSDDGARQAASEINAKAFTNRNNIYLARGHYDTDIQLMAHEATHVVQQRFASQKNILQRFGEELGESTGEVDDSAWESADETVIYFLSDERLFVLPGNGIVFRIPESSAPAPRAIYGVAAVSAGGARVVTTGNGQGIIIDAGANRGTTFAAYMFQLATLAARMGANTITGIHITHAHADHTQHFEATVRRYNIPAANVVIPEFQARWATDIQAQWRNLAADPGVAALGYNNTGPVMDGGMLGRDPNLSYYRVRMQHGDLIFEYRITGDAARALRDATSRPAAHAIDSASALISIRQAGTIFRMIEVGDLRGGDIADLYDALNGHRPGAFDEVFRGVEVVGGMQHHLGRVNDARDVEGIGHLLRATALTSGRLEVVVQTDSSQMREALVQALNVLGVDVSYTLAGSESLASSIETLSDQSVVTRGAAVRRSASDADRSLIRRIAEIRTLRDTFSRNRDHLGSGYSESEITRIEREFNEAETRLTNLYNQRNQMTVGRLRGLSSSASTGVTFDAAALARNSADIMAEQPIDRTLRTREFGDRLREMRMMEANSYELEMHIRNAVHTGSTTARMRELIEVVSPRYAREVMPSGTNARARREFLRRLYRQAGVMSALNTGARVPTTRLGRGVMGGTGLLLAGVEIANMVGPIISQERMARAGRLGDAYRTLVWWLAKQIIPPVTGVVDNFFESDTVYTDLATITEKFDSNELHGLTVGAPTDDLDWAKLAFWMTENVRDYNDYFELVVDLRTIAIRPEGAGDFSERSWQLRTWGWSDSVGAGLRDTWETNDRLTTIMQATAERVVSGTEGSLAARWASRDEPVETTPSFRSADEHDPPIPESLRPIGRAGFRQNANKRLFSLYGDRVLINNDGWWSDTPRFFVLEDLSHSSRTLVMGADYNTYAAMRRVRQYVRDSMPPLARGVDTRAWYDILSARNFTREERAAAEMVIQGRAEFDSTERDRWHDGTFHFPGEVDNRSAIGYVNPEDIVRDS